MKEVPTMENGITSKAAGDILLKAQNKHFVVVGYGRPVGTIQRDEILKALSADENRPLEKVKNNNLAFVKNSMALDKAWKILRQSKKPMLVVGSHGFLEGIVDEENVAEFIHLKSGRK